MQLHGHIDGVEHTRIFGWARDNDAPDRPVSLLVTVNGELVARVVANTFRSDLLEAQVGNEGRLSFLVPVSLSPLQRHFVEVTAEASGELLGSPSFLEAPVRFDAATRAAIAAVMAAAGSDAEVTARLSFLATQSESLRRVPTQSESLRRPPSRPALPGSKRRSKSTTKPAAAIEAGPKVLVIDATVPCLERDAGSVAIVSHMQSLQRLGYAVTLLPSDLVGDTGLPGRLGITLLARPYYSSVEEALLQHASAFDAVYVHRLCNAIYLPLIRRYQPAARLVFSVADLSSLRTRRQGEVQKRPELLAQSRHEASLERLAVYQADAVITHSTFEATLLAMDSEPGKVHVVPFAPGGQPSAVPFAARLGVAFVGSFTHAPNVDAAFWLADAIMPLMVAGEGPLTCELVGSGMTDSVRRLASPSIVPTGKVDDLSTVFDRVRLSIAPLAFGAGVKGKVLSSLAAGVPCVCTPVAAEGLGLPAPLDALVATDPAGLAALALRLHDDEAFNAECAQAGLDYVASRVSPASIDAALGTAMGRVGLPRLS